MRRRAREAALQILYSAEFHGQAPAVAAERYWDVLAAAAAVPVVEVDDAASLSTDTAHVHEIRAFADTLVRGVLTHQEELDAAIREASTNWRLDRMAIVDRNILRVATFELRYLSDVPARATLNEAIEVAKRYGTEDSGAFINGILDRISAWAKKA